MILSRFVVLCVLLTPKVSLFQALGWDLSYRKHVHYYDRHRNEYRRDAARVWHKLCGLGCEGILTPEKSAPPLL